MLLHLVHSPGPWDPRLLWNPMAKVKIPLHLIRLESRRPMGGLPALRRGAKPRGMLREQLCRGVRILTLEPAALTVPKEA